MFISNNDVVLFQGDSITDAGRLRETPTEIGGYENYLGFGFAMMVESWFNANYPELNVKFINRGIGGNLTKDLVTRWDEDCIELKPTIVSILVGINDCWRRYDSNHVTSVEEFEENYRNLLQQIKDRLDAKIILCEPFVLPVPDDRIKWREDLDPKINVVRKLAREFNALLLPLDGIFSSVSAQKAPEFWAPDGVHPSFSGHALIAKEWLKLTKCI